MSSALSFTDKQNYAHACVHPDTRAENSRSRYSIFYSNELLKLLFQDLERTFASSDESAFEAVLYAGIKDAAIATCLPKVATAEEAAASLSSQSSNEASSEAELAEYNQLLETIFADFETFLANANIPGAESASEADGDALDKLVAKLNVVCPKVRAPCSRIFKHNEPTFRCK